MVFVSQGDIQGSPKVSWRLGSCKYFTSYRNFFLDQCISIGVDDILRWIQVFPTSGFPVINFMPTEPPKINFVSLWESELTWSQKSLAPIEIHWSKKILITSIGLKIFALSEASTYFRWALYICETRITPESDFQDPFCQQSAILPLPYYVISINFALFYHKIRLYQTLIFWHLNIFTP